jgi:uncharacterized membrane protein YoaK (UPF0700 family)
VPGGAPLWAQVARGNAASAPAFLAAGFVPLGARGPARAAAPVRRSAVATDQNPAPQDPAPHDPGLHDPAPHGSGPHGPGPHSPGPHDPAPQKPEPTDPMSLLAALMVLTLVSGLVDAVSYLGLGHVFTANMTGNVVVLGFAAAGAPGFSAPATLTSLGLFLLGAVIAGRVAAHIAGHVRLLLITMAVEAALVGAAALAALLAGATTAGWGRYTVIAILALAMGMRNAAVRRLAVRDVTTTVLTQTLTGLATDSSLAGGTNPRAGRRIIAVIAMLAGAAAGAVMYLHVNAALPLLVSAVLTATTAVAFRTLGSRPFASPVTGSAS